MYMDGNKSLKLGSVHLGEVMCRLVNQVVQQLKESLISQGHHFTVVPGAVQGLGGVTGPDHLNTQQTNLDKKRR